ncbi:hypothetical protein K438DRAFT_1608760, partial [Mycena galopus ATCC 62051]
VVRNQENAHSLGYCFREAQAVELRLGTWGDRRPARNRLRKCERRRASCCVRFQ